MSEPDRCTCRPGRDHDGSEFGPCEWCEQQEPEVTITCQCGMSGTWPEMGEDGCWACDPRNNERVC